MKQPIVAKCFSLAGSLAMTKRRLRDSERSNVALARSMRVLSERVTAVGVERDGWKARAQSLYQLVDPEMRDEVLKTHAWIDSFPVVEGPRSAP